MILYPTIEGLNEFEELCSGRVELGWDASVRENCGRLRFILDKEI